MTFILTIGVAAIPFGAALAAGVLALFVFLRHGGDAFSRRVGAVLLAVAAGHAAAGLMLSDSLHAAAWGYVVFVSAMAEGVALLAAAQALVKGEGDVPSAMPFGDVRLRMWILSGGLLVLALVGRFSPFVESVSSPDLSRELVLLTMGRVVTGFILVTMILSVAQLEQLLRGLRDPARYQVKVLLIGLGTLATYQIYLASRLLLLPRWFPGEASIAGLVTVVALVVISFGLRRLHREKSSFAVYVSPRVAHASITFLAVGLYLLGVGLVGEWVRYTGYLVSDALSVVVIFVGLIGLVLVASSRTARTRLGQFVARNFYQTAFDYRAKWLEVTEAFGRAASPDEILDQTLTVLSRTFGTPRLSIWLKVEADQRFHQVRTVNTEPAPEPVDPGHPVVRRLMEMDEPLDVRDIEKTSPACGTFLTATGGILAVPIRSGSTLLGWFLLGPKHQLSEPYATDDHDLLRAIAHHAGVLLSLAQLAEDRRAAAEIEAVNQLAAFCIHDLKNLANRLSLIMQNAQVHGNDRDFQASAIRTVGTTVDKMMALIAKLSPTSRMGNPDPHAPVEPVEIRELLDECVSAFKVEGEWRILLHCLTDRHVLARRDQLADVLTNLVLNAEQAMQGKGIVAIKAEDEEERVVITVSDEGPGIPVERLRTLFRPFSTSKAGGLGLGLYQCKRMIEAMKGTIRVESEEGKGTRTVLTLFAAQTRVGPTRELECAG